LRSASSTARAPRSAATTASTTTAAAELPQHGYGDE
jgi:hypothetical protein